jgi:hypothetical protein
MVASAGAARAQFFSPGPLAAPHAPLEGLDNCARCHEQEQRHSPVRCLGCHAELAPEIGRHAGYHGRLPSDVRDQCQQCHPDHRGRDFHLVDWQGPISQFDHRRTGWALAGKHAAVRCEGCHERSKVVAPEIVRLLAAQPHRTTFLGLSARCDSCHTDEHRGQLGRECQHCHDETAWKPAPRFDHQVTEFPLRGRHKGVRCSECHPTVEDEDQSSRGGKLRSFMQMKPIDHGGCASCHDDPHEGKLGGRCASCHSETSWHVINAGGGGDRKFHARTRFPLEGAHLGAPCRSCHGPFPGAPARFRGLPFASCTDCHADAHVGQLAGRGAGAKRAPDCASCHDTSAFSPARFEPERHAQTRFPLEGAHEAAACRGCHPLDPKLETRVPAAVRNTLEREHRPLLVSTAVLRPMRWPNLCSSCHQDVHQGQFAPQIEANDCRGCHSTTSFSVLRFDHDRDTHFPLTGAHRTSACTGCHPREVLRPHGPPAVRYVSVTTTCTGCHTDTHQGQFSQPAPGRAVRDCSFCHGTDRFSRTQFSHADPQFTTFALRGRHADLGCKACHLPVEIAAGLQVVRYRPLPRACAGCHVDFHKGDFRGFEP